VGAAANVDIRDTFTEMEIRSMYASNLESEDSLSTVLLEATNELDFEVDYDHIVDWVEQRLVIGLI
jgi:hypothetical protein